MTALRMLCSVLPLKLAFLGYIYNMSSILVTLEHTRRIECFLIVKYTHRSYFAQTKPKRAELNRCHIVYTPSKLIYTFTELV